MSLDLSAVRKNHDGLFETLDKWSYNAEAEIAEPFRGCLWCFTGPSNSSPWFSLTLSRSLQAGGHDWGMRLNKEIRCRLMVRTKHCRDGEIVHGRNY